MDEGHPRVNRGVRYCCSNATWSVSTAQGCVYRHPVSPRKISRSSKRNLVLSLQILLHQEVPVDVAGGHRWDKETQLWEELFLRKISKSLERNCERIPFRLRNCSKQSTKWRARQSLNSSFGHWPMTSRSDIAAIIRAIALVKDSSLRAPYITLVRNLERGAFRLYPLWLYSNAFSNCINGIQRLEWLSKRKDLGMARRIRGDVSKQTIVDWEFD